jgi:ribonucleoside-diphosphate reductase alpha chain
MDKRGWEGLTAFSKQMYLERYFEPGEDYEKWLYRVSESYADDEAHARRIRNYIGKYWFHPSTPVASNAGLPDKGLPISCYTNEVSDSKAGIFAIWHENNWLGSFGGGIGTSWSNVRGIGEAIGTSGKSSGIIPFIKVSDATTLAVSQGGLRRASQAVYLDVSHPEIEEFIDIRRPTGDKERRSHNIHHGITISDEFMRAVEARGSWDLVSPKTGEKIKTVDAFDLFKKILITRMETGEPYLFFKDTANAFAPEEYARMGYSINTSNLCSEIMLHTDEKTTGVCCLTSVNLEYFDEWANDEQFLEDIHRYTDNVLQSFIDLTENMEGFEKARNGAIKERSLGIGVMGYHSYLQRQKLSYDSLAAKYVTSRIFSHIHDELEKSNRKLAEEKGTAPISEKRRNVNVTAIAPTASISTLCNLASPGIDPRISNIYTAKTNIGSFTIKNKYLEKLLEEKGYNTKEVWDSITKAEGSVQHLDFLSDEEKAIFLTAHEIDNRFIIRNVAEMQPHINQGISCNLFLPSDIHVRDLYNIHIQAWKSDLKSLYYVRSKAISRASIGSIERVKLEEDTCLGCA